MVNVLLLIIYLKISAAKVSIPHCRPGSETLFFVKVLKMI